MSTALILALLAFGFALVHALVLDRWQRAIAEAAHAPDPLPAPNAQVSVLVPARDAAQTLIPLLQDLHAQDHPRERHEVLVIDDHSTDGTGDVVCGMMERWPEMRLVELEATRGKKAAIGAGVEYAVGDILVMTDADVRCSPRRSSAIAARMADGTGLLLMPVYTTGGRGPSAWMQRVEQLALQGVAMGSALTGRPWLANGANMAFLRRAFDHVGGYAGDRWASGDDMFLLARMRAHRVPVAMLAIPDVVVHTAPVEGWQKFFAQRLRWAGKMRAYRDVGGLLGTTVALLFPWALAAFTVWVMRHVQVGQGLFFTGLLLIAAWLLWLGPIIRLVEGTHRFFAIGDPGAAKRPGDGPLFTIAALIAFMIYAPVIALLSIFVRPTWKGRRI